MPMPLDAMTEATRLTRAGRLDEATALLRGALGAGPAAPARRQGAVGPIDMMPPAAGSGGAWTAPTAVSGPASAKGAGARRTARTAPARDPLPPGARWEERAHAGPAGSRPYKLYVPASRRGRALPLVVMLHGCGQDPDDFAAGTRMNEVAEEAGLLVAYPAQVRAANAGRCWNWFSAADQRREGGEAAVLAALARQVAHDEGAAAGRTYVAGLSAGGAMAAILGQAHPDLFAAVGVHSGLACGAARDLPGALAAMRNGAPGAGRARPVPAIVFHGDRDATVHPSNGEAVAAQAGDAARREVARGRSPGGLGYTRTVGRDASGRAVLEHWLVHGLGHAWSGGGAAGTHTDPRGPDASRETVRFFLEHEGRKGPRR